MLKYDVVHTPGRCTVPSEVLIASRERKGEVVKETVPAKRIGF